MPITYNPTLWSSGITPLNPTNMNKIEQGIVTAINGVNDIESGSIIAGKSTNDAAGDPIVSTYARKVNLTLSGSSLDIELLAKDLTPTGTSSVDLSTVCMMLSGNQTISGTKSFSKLQTTHSPNANNDVVPLTYLNTNHYTKTEVNNLLADKANESDCLTRYNSTNQEYVAQGNLNMDSFDIKNVRNIISDDGGWDWISNASDESLEDVFATKQDVLVSGSSIKTVNGDSVLGSGNLVSHLGTLLAQITYNSSDNEYHIDDDRYLIENHLVGIKFKSAFDYISFAVGLIVMDENNIYIKFPNMEIDVAEGMADCKGLIINKSTGAVTMVGDLYFNTNWIVNIYQL